MGMPKQGSPEQAMAQAMTNQALGVRIAKLRDSRRAFDKATTDALLDEAQRRLYWTNSYIQHLDDAS